MIDYNRLFEEEIQKGEHKRLLLHVCCAPCLASAILRVKDHFDLTLFYYNPNIRPFEEYEKRFFEIGKLLRGLNLDNVNVIKGEYEKDVFDTFLIPKKDEREGGSRCMDCITTRLEKTAEFARKNGFDLFSTTLTSSPHKNAQFINEKGIELSSQTSLWLPSDFKKKDGVLVSKKLCQEYEIYRQNYCGCNTTNRDAVTLKSTSDTASVVLNKE